MQPSFIQVLRGEALKTKGAWGLTLSLLGPLGASLLILIFLVVNNEKWINEEEDMWFSLGRYHFNFYFLLYPLFTALTAYLISNVEHKANGFKQLFAMPVPKLYFFVSKLLLLLGWLAASLLLATALPYLLGYLLQWIYPQATSFQLHSPDSWHWRNMLNLSGVLVAILAIHYVLSIYFQNFIISIGAACFLFMCGLAVANNWEYDYLIPYTHSTKIFIEYISQGKADMVGKREMWINVGYALFFFTVGFWMFSRKQIKN